MRDIASGVACVVIGAVTLLWLIPAGVVIRGSPPSAALSPAFWPQILAAFLAFCGVWLAAENTVRRARWRISEGRAESSTDSSRDPPTLYFRLVVAVGLLFPYYLACSRLGLLLPSVAAIFIYSWLAGYRNYPVIIGYSIVLPIMVTALLLYGAGVRVPLGPLRGFF